MKQLYNEASQSCSNHSAYPSSPDESADAVHNIHSLVIRSDPNTHTQTQTVQVTVRMPGFRAAGMKGGGGARIPSRRSSPAQGPRKTWRRIRRGYYTGAPGVAA
uniref:Uncharacterized protein n=1 Tax=Zea mays TaxID=4577 RepID=C4J4Q7_MAIZE|nr:unknown [Zea mays]